MKTPKLNTEIYIRLREVCRQKDEAALNKQGGSSSVESPGQSVINQMNKDTHPPTKLEKDLFQKLNNADSSILQCYKLLNYW